MAQALQHMRVAYFALAYFGSATASLAWILHRTRPARERTWSTLVEDAMSLWVSVPSELGVFILANFFVSALALAAVLTAFLFLGRLSVTESQRLSHRLLKYALFKMVFVGSIITPDPRDFALWLAWFAVVGYLRVFLGAAKDRLESLVSSPGAQFSRHARGVCLLLLVLVHNALAFAVVLEVMRGQSLARVMLCAFDSVVIAIEGIKTLLRYAVHMADRFQCLGPGAPLPAAPAAADDEDLARGGAAAVGTVGAVSGGGWDLGWSGKGSFLYHAELVADVLVHGFTLAHYMHVWILHGVSFHLIDAVLLLDMRAVLLSLLRRLRSHVSYRAATSRLNTSFRDVHPAALAAASGGASIDCTICMDEIVHVAKQLPCGHVFHLSCLRAWLQQSGSESFTCPNCRKPILVADRAGAGGDVAGAQGRRAPSWWLFRLFDLLYVRLIVSLETLMLSLLLRLLLWLNGRAGRVQLQVRRRSRRTPPSPPLEGTDESPWPAGTRPQGPLGILRGWTWRGTARHSGFFQEMFDDLFVELGNQQNGEEAEDMAMGTRDGGGNNGGGGSTGEIMTHDEMEQRTLQDSSEDEGDGSVSGGGMSDDEDSHSDGEGRKSHRSGSWRLSPANMCVTRRLHPAPSEHGCGGTSGPGPSNVSEPLGEHRRRQRMGAVVCYGAHGQHHEPHRRSPGRGPLGSVADIDGAAGPSGPTTVTATAPRLHGALRSFPLSADVPSYSGDVLVPQAAAFAQRLGQTVSISLRSTLSMGGVCAGAVAWAGSTSDDDGDVSSRRRRTGTGAGRGAQRRSPAGGSREPSPTGEGEGEGGTATGEPRRRRFLGW